MVYLTEFGNASHFTKAIQSSEMVQGHQFGAVLFVAPDGMSRVMPFAGSTDMDQTITIEITNNGPQLMGVESAIINWISIEAEEFKKAIDQCHTTASSSPSYSVMSVMSGGREMHLRHNQKVSFQFSNPDQAREFMEFLRGFELKAAQEYISVKESMAQRAEISASPIQQDPFEELYW